MASRHHTKIPERKLQQSEGAPTSAPNTRSASKKDNGLGAYTMSGSGAPANGSRSTSRGFTGTIKERTAGDGAPDRPLALRTMGDVAV